MHTHNIRITQTFTRDLGPKPYTKCRRCSRYTKRSVLEFLRKNHAVSRFRWKEKSVVRYRVAAPSPTVIGAIVKPACNPPHIDTLCIQHSAFCCVVSVVVLLFTWMTNKTAACWTLNPTNTGAQNPSSYDRFSVKIHRNNSALYLYCPHNTVFVFMKPTNIRALTLIDYQYFNIQ